MVPDIEFALLLLPGFFVYATLLRFIGGGEKRRDLETVFFSLLISVVIAGTMTFLAEFDFLRFDVLDYRFYAWMVVLYITLTVLLLVFFKYIFPALEKYVQLFDRVKRNTNDVVKDVFEDAALTYKSAWLQVRMKNSKVYTGYLAYHGVTRTDREAIYLRRPKITNKGSKENLSHIDGLLLLLDDVDYIAVLDTLKKSRNTRKKAS